MKHLCLCSCAAARPVLPLHAIALVAVGGACLLVALVIIILVIVKKYSSVKQRQRAYSVAEGQCVIIQT